MNSSVPAPEMISEEIRPQRHNVTASAKAAGHTVGRALSPVARGSTQDVVVGDWFLKECQAWDEDGFEFSRWPGSEPAYHRPSKAIMPER